MASRRLLNRLFYFTVEDEGILAEAFPRFEPEVFCIAYKVVGADDVFVTTAETREAMDRHDVPYNLLADEEAGRIALLHNTLSKEELSEYDEALRALTLAHRAIGAACVGVNGDAEVGPLVAADPERFTYFTAPAGHTFLWRLFADRKDAVAFARKRGDKKAVEWAEALPLASARELKSFH
ncbi:MAG: hypothetical protein F9K18_14525 [Thermoanaerobaculia bacterium]|nr:MAG: hypothetical protein F9K18_14525 [Thermoanaerobaculia bacterium]MBZ0103921.1 hypothetical protein [Thermoanaerobaculia bacterium]